MKITIYELLGLVKDGKAPKKIRFLNHYYIWKENDEDYQKEDGLMLFGNIKINYILNSKVEIIEDILISKLYINNELQYDLEEEKKIPKKLPKSVTDNACSSKDMRLIANTLNQLIDYLKSKGDE